MVLIKTDKNIHEINLNQQLTVRTAHKCAHITVHLNIIQHRTVLIIFPLILRIYALATTY